MLSGIPYNIPYCGSLHQLDSLFCRKFIVSKEKFNVYDTSIGSGRIL